MLRNFIQKDHPALKVVTGQDYKSYSASFRVRKNGDKIAVRLEEGIEELGLPSTFKSYVSCATNIGSEESTVTVSCAVYPGGNSIRQNNADVERLIFRINEVMAKRSGELLETLRP